MADSTSPGVQARWLPYVATGKNDKYPLNPGVVWTGGLVALFLLLVAVLLMVVPKVEARLSQQAHTALADAGIDTSLLSFSWNYRNLSVYGELPPGVEIDQLATTLNPTSSSNSLLFADGVRHLRMDVAKPQIPVKSTPVIRRLDVRFFTDGKVTTLDGTVQTHDQRERLVNAALQAGGESISDNLDVMIGNTAKDGGDVKVDALARMLEKSGPRQVAVGQATLSTRNLTYRYTAKDRDAAKLIEQASSLTMVDFEVIGEMEYIKHGSIEAKAVGNGNGITLSGTVLSDVQLKRLQFAAAEAVGIDNVTNLLTVSGEEAKLPGANDRVEVMANALSLFGPGSTVAMQLARTDLTVDAVVEHDQDRIALLDALHGSRETGAGDNSLTVNEKIEVLNAIENNQVDLLQQRLDTYTQEIRRTVVFDSGQSGLSRRARSTLEKVANTLAEYPGLKVEVEGHTDNVGRARTNDELSQQRANAVRDYLITQTVPADRLVAVGYGQRRPLESNDTAEGRRLNRRVHFSVLENPGNE